MWKNVFICLTPSKNDVDNYVYKMYGCPQVLKIWG